jgi:tRNA-dependent cyclodipeptide synthase
MILPYHVQIRENTVSEYNVNNSCCLQISVGSPAYEGGKLYSLIEWCISKFKEIFFFVNDTLQRHNYLEIEEHSRYAIATNEGYHWVERNKCYFPKPEEALRVGIVHWERWLEDFLFQRTLKDFKSLYQNDLIFKKTVDQDIKEYTDRKLKSGISSKYEKVLYKSCLDYVLEEVAIYEIQQLSYGSINIHAGNQLKVFKYLKDNKTVNFRLSQREAIYVSLKKRRGKCSIS